MTFFCNYLILMKIIEQTANWTRLIFFEKNILNLLFLTNDVFHLDQQFVLPEYKQVGVAITLDIVWILLWNVAIELIWTK